jgi:hypothetical protein
MSPQLSSNRKNPNVRFKWNEGTAPKMSKSFKRVTKAWGSDKDVTLYLDRCQVDTSEDLVARVWQEVLRRRPSIGSVVDFGAGDGRFSRAGRYASYVGFEIDPRRFAKTKRIANARMVQNCAFSQTIMGADLAIGNPPYVRNQDLPLGWRQQAAEVLKRRTGITLSGLANAWQYFFLLSIASTSEGGVVALVIPYEWVSRPSSRILRDYIKSKRWNVSVYRLSDDAFSRVLTTSSITVVDKATSDGSWRFYNEKSDGRFVELPSETGVAAGVLPYVRNGGASAGPCAKRGLSPGTQKVLTLTEAARAHLGLQPNTDVVPCVTSLRHLPSNVLTLNAATFREHYRDAGKKCWLIRTDTRPSPALRRYLNSVAECDRATATCTNRDRWWCFTMPSVASILVSSGFRGSSTKAVKNDIRARAVGSVCGVYRVKRREREKYVATMRSLAVGTRVVAHSNGLKKLEINQLNSILGSIGRSS